LASSSLTGWDLVVGTTLPLRTGVLEGKDTTLPAINPLQKQILAPSIGFSARFERAHFLELPEPILFRIAH
jgi:hypothetical protein